MSWNEPGGGKGPRDPWGGKDQGPPDLDEALRKLQDQLNGLFGGRSGGGGRSSRGSGSLLGIACRCSRHRLGFAGADSDR